MSWFNWLANPLGALTGGITGEGWSGSGLTSSPLGADSQGNTLSNVWDRFKNGETNIMNKQIADQNLRFQYENLEYNKALNQQIFDRADTAYQRQAQDAQAVGINPMALAGTGGAQVGNVSLTEPMHNDQVWQDTGVLGAISPAISMIQGISDFQTGNVNRDLLAQQADSQRIQNLVEANKYGLYQDSNGNWKFDPSRQPHASRTFEDLDIAGKNLSNEGQSLSNEGQSITNQRNQRVNDYQEESGTNDTTTDRVRNLTDVLTNDNILGLFGKASKVMFQPASSKLAQAIAVGVKLLQGSKKANQEIQQQDSKPKQKKSKSKKTTSLRGMADNYYNK